MLPITYRVIAYIKRHEPTYEPVTHEPSLRQLWQCPKVSAATRGYVGT